MPTARITYAGIGARHTPPDVLALMHRIAGALAQRCWVLRTGGAPGADQAFAAAPAMPAGPPSSSCHGPASSITRPRG
jgi:hypothetical protein